ncbi:abortive infection family protein [Xanthobacter sp. V0B-10]|uniref:abortive infection family protein n=1 Tax=Xanthobacter albus TaxID=3119929 RepID=UPI00372B8D4E
MRNGGLSAWLFGYLFFASSPGDIVAHRLIQRETAAIGLSMPKILLSHQSIEALAEIITGGPAGFGGAPIGIYRTHDRIGEFFAAAGVSFQSEGLTRVRGTVRTLSGLVGDPSLEGKLRRVIESAADPRDFIHDADRHDAVLEYLNKHFDYDGLRLEKLERGVRLVAHGNFAAVVHTLADAASDIDFDTVQQDLERAQRGAEEDPETAVTAACSIIESVCRSVLVELGLPLPAKKDVQGLYQAVREPLGLAPNKDGIPDLIADDVRSILGGINTVVNGIGALRTHAGSAHGRERGHRRIDARIARLSLHAASTIALFLVETWQMKFPNRKLPRK